MKEKLTKNLSLKIIAVLFAAGLWMISININDPYQTKDYSVTVQLQNMNTMSASGKYVEVVNDSDRISVKVRGNRSVMDNFSADNISAVADLNELDENSHVPIKVSTKISGNKIESVRPSSEYLTVKVEDVLKVQKNIEVVTKNTPAKGYILGKTSTEQNALRVSGPGTLVNTVEKAVVNFDLEGAKDDVSMILPIELYDKEGRKINDERLKTSIKEVQCVATILETKEVPVRFSVKGIPAKGYGFTGEIKSEPSTVLIAAKSSIIRKVDEIEISQSVDVYNAKENVMNIIDLKEFLPDNVVIAAASFDGKVKAVAVIEQEVTKTMKVSTDEITILNMPDGLKAKLTDERELLEIEITGYESVISEFHEKDLKAQVDVVTFMAEENITELETGSYKMKISFELPEGMWLKEENGEQIEISVE